MALPGIVIRKRITAVFLLLALVVIGLLGRIAWVQLVQGSNYQREALELRQREISLLPERGVIYDRRGRELAVSVSAPSVGAFPAEVRRSENPRETARQLAELLLLPEDRVYEKITSNQSYVYLKKRLDFDLGPKIRSLKLPGIEVVDQNQRFYPKGSLAAQVLGIAGDENQGLEGLEYLYEKDLQGVPGSLRIEFDAAGREIPQATQQYMMPRDGNSLVLTIDETIQYFTERELDALMVSPTAPQRASIVVMDPETGEVLAMASRPTFDPNKYVDYPGENRRNLAVAYTYEPGSTFKVVTTAASLQEGTVKPADRFYDPGYIKVGKETISCWRSGRPHGSQSFIEGVQNSCNPVFVEVALRLEGKAKGLFYSYIKDFGFGARTGVDAYGEEIGLVKSKTEAEKQINVATMGIGQGISVTPIQLVTALSAIANGGKLMQPYLVKEIRGPDGRRVQEFKPEIIRQVLRPEVAQQTAEILELVVSQGTGYNAYIPGYRVGGKTGTAQKAGKGGYQPGRYVASFLGFAPVNDPRLAVLVFIDEPQGVYYGGTVAAPVFRRVMEDSLRYLEVPAQYNPDILPRNALPPPPEKTVIVPDVTGLLLAKGAQAIKAAGLQVQTVGEGEMIVDQTPKGLARVRPSTVILLYLAKTTPAEDTVTIPDLTGLRIGEATALLEALGLKIKPFGFGEALEESPVPGTVVPAGSQVKVIFAEPPAAYVLAPLSP